MKHNYALDLHNDTQSMIKGNFIYYRLFLMYPFTSVSEQLI